jgi:hypothetical protein
MDNSEKFLESLALDPDSLSQQVLSFSSFFNILLAAILGFMILLVYLGSSGRDRRDHNLYMVIPVLSVLMAVIMRIDSSKAVSFFAIFGIMSVIRFRSDITDQRGITFILFAVIEGLIVGLNAYLLAMVAWIVVSGAILIGRYLFNHREGFRLTLRHNGPLPQESLRAIVDWFDAKGVPISSTGLGISNEYSSKGQAWEERYRAEFMLFPKSEKDLLAMTSEFLELSTTMGFEVELKLRGPS